MDSRRIQAVLNNLDITFIKCKFIYARVGDGIGQNKNFTRRKSTFRNILDKLDELSGASLNRYEGCTFFPGDEEEVKKQISLFETDTMKFKFIECKFVRRESTFKENVVRKLRRIFGITFELNYVTGTAEIEDHKFKIKDIPEVITLVVERIQDN